MSVITIVGDNGKTYDFDDQVKKVFLVAPNTTMSMLLIGLVLAFFVAIGYDYVKDFFRGMSGYHDVTHGNARSGFFKFMGWTSGNMKRTLLIIAIVVAMYFVSKRMDTRQEIPLSDVPADVKDKFLAQMSK